MSLYKYLIIGGGMTADAAVGGIRELDQQGSIAIISEEDVPPYNRPPLSKGLWKGKPLEKIWRKAAAASAEIILGTKAVSLDPEAKSVVDNQGSEYTYEKLLLATGGTPRRLPFGGDGIIYFRTLNDFQRLHQCSGQGNHFAVIGGGFIGAEIAAALAMNGNKVTMLFPEEGIGSRVYPPEISQYLNDYYRSKGVEVLAGVNVTDIRDLAGIYSVSTDKEPGIQAACVVAGIGIIPNTELASKAGIAVKNGIIVDSNLKTNLPDIYSAGDVAEFLYRVRKNLTAWSTKITPIPWVCRSGVIWRVQWNIMSANPSSIQTYSIWDMKRSVNSIHVWRLLLTGRILSKKV